MGTCKKCGKETTLLTSLCEDCKKIQKELDQAEKKKKEDDLVARMELVNQKIKEETKDLIDVIVKSTTQEEPLMYFFIQNDIVKKDNKNSTGTIVGGALGGIMGAMIGSAFNSGSESYTGNIGILVVTKTKIIVNVFKTNIHFPKCIHYSQLKQLLSEISSKKTLKHGTFEIEGSHIYPECIISGAKTFSFVQSRIYINDNDSYDLPTVDNFVQVCNDLGSLLTAEEFMHRLEKKSNPMSEPQFNVMMNKNKAFFDEVFNKIIEKKDNIILINNFVYTLPSIRKVLVLKLQKKAKTLNSNILTSRVLLIVSILLLVIVIVLFNKEGDEILGAIFLIIVLLGTSIASSSYYSKYKSAKWAKNIIIENKMTHEEYLTSEAKLYIAPTPSENEIEANILENQKDTLILDQLNLDGETKASIKKMNRTDAIVYCREKFDLSLRDAKKLINQIGLNN